MQYAQTLNALKGGVGQLRHAYEHLAAGRVANQPEMARGLISPAIRLFEKFIGDLEGTRAIRHKKRGSTYNIIGVAKIQCEQPLNDMDEVVLYVGNDGQVWARPESEIRDGRFDILEPK